MSNRAFYFMGLLVLTIITIALDGIVQNIVVIITLIVANKYFQNIFNADNKIYRAINIIILMYCGLTYWQYFNAVNMGFSDGIYFGFLNNQLYSDTNNYYYEAMELTKVFSGPSLVDWLKGEYPHYGFYGPYNIQNILVALEILIFGDDIITLIFIKIIFNIITFYAIYKISLDNFKVKNPVVPVIITALFPGYILVSTSLMRDNILTFFITMLFFIYLHFLRTDNISFKGIIFTLTVIISLSFLRLYSLLFVFGMFIHYWVVKKNKVKGIIVFFLIGVVCLFILMYLYITSTGIMNLFSTFFDYDVARNNWFGQKTQGVNGVKYAIYATFLSYIPPSFNPSLFVVAEFWDYTGKIFLNILLFTNTIFLFKYIFNRNNKERLFMIIFCLLIPFVFCLAHTIALGATIVRIYCMWVWIIAIYVVNIYENMNVNARRVSILLTVSIVIMLNILMNSYR